MMFNLKGLHKQVAFRHDRPFKKRVARGLAVGGTVLMALAIGMVTGDGGAVNSGSNVARAAAKQVAATTMKLPVSVTDTKGQTFLKKTFEYDTTNNKVACVDVSVPGYPLSQLKSLTMNYDPDNSANNQKIKSVTYTVSDDNQKLTVEMTSQSGAPQSAPYTLDQLKANLNDNSLSNFGQAIEKMTAGGPFAFNSTTTFDGSSEAYHFLTGVNVVYNAKLNANVRYVDADNNNNLVKTDTISDFKGNAGTYNVTVPSGYVLKDASQTPIHYTMASDNQTYTVALVHSKSYTTMHRNRQIDFHMANSGDANKLPQSIVQTIGYNVTTDNITGSRWAFPEASFPAVNVPIISGYTPSQSTVPEFTPASTTAIDSLNSPFVVDVTYTPNPQSATIHYVYQDGTSAHPNETVNGVTDQQFNVDSPVISGYTPDSNQISKAFSADPSQNTYTVTYYPTGTPVSKGKTLYAVKPIYMYQNPTFKKRQRIAEYVKKPRINRPMFVVVGSATSKNGAARYKVRDVNHHSKTAGKVGYITASQKFVLPVYYQHGYKWITVINPNGVNGYRKKNLTGKVKNIKQGTQLKVTKIVRHRLTTRFYLANGHYMTANRKLVIAGKYKQPQKIQARQTIYRYSTVNFGKRTKLIKKGTKLTVKRWVCSRPTSMTSFGAKRYAVAGGYVTANHHFVKVIK